jgi:hypothetical protein
MVRDSQSRERHDRAAALESMHRAGGPVIDAVNARIAEAGLEAVSIFPQVVQQAGETGFIAGAKGCGEPCGEVGDVAEMLIKPLPF